MAILSTPDHEGLEVVKIHPLPEVVPHSAPQVVPQSAPEVVPWHEGLEVVKSDGSYDKSLPIEHRILGVRRKFFWTIIAVIAVIVIAGAVGAGVGLSKAK